MNYVTKAQLVDRFGADELAQLTDRFGDGDLDDDVLNATISDAGAVIDSYLSPRYTLPLAQSLIDASPLPTVAGDLVRYQLMNILPPDDVRDRRRDAIAWLKDVQAGRASLGEQDTAVATSEGRVTTAQGASKTDWETY